MTQCSLQHRQPRTSLSFPFHYSPSDVCIVCVCICRGGPTPSHSAAYNIVNQEPPSLPLPAPVVGGFAAYPARFVCVCCVFWLLSISPCGCKWVCTCVLVGACVCFSITASLAGAAFLPFLTHSFTHSTTPSLTLQSIRSSVFSTIREGSATEKSHTVGGLAMLDAGKGSSRRATVLEGACDGC